MCIPLCIGSDLRRDQVRSQHDVQAAESDFAGLVLSSTPIIDRNNALIVSR